ncbi:MAG: helix-turn-helix transcriptional regulator [Bacteroidales bacterium]|nr:helix-turn-helix transcriptional regulator [Bacteroidales bacterium]
MKDRLLKFLNHEGLSSAKFAEVIGVQPSGISHVLSGRNKPGFDFISKVLSSYPELNADWLILGKGNMLKSIKQPTLFDEPGNTKNVATPNLLIQEQDISKTSNHKPEINASEAIINDPETKEENTFSDIEKIIILYTDNSFKEYFPKQKK